MLVSTTKFLTMGAAKLLSWVPHNCQIILPQR